MEKRGRIYFIIGLFTIGFLLNSCEEVPFLNDGQDTLTVEKSLDYTSLLAILDIDDSDELEEASELKASTTLEYGPCFEFIIQDNGTDSRWPRMWTISYTDTSCYDRFDNLKLGAIDVTLTDFWKNEGSVRTMIYNNFTINGNPLEGTRTITNTGFNADSNLVFERKFENGSYTQGDTATMTWNFLRNVELIEGYETFPFKDDEYLVTGAGDGVNFDGLAFSVNITDTLHYKNCSRYPVSGELSIETEGFNPILIYFGDGECDNSASMIIDGDTTEISVGYCRY